MSQSQSTEQRLKELKETYVRLFSDRGGIKRYSLPADDILLTYRRPFFTQGSNKDEKKENVTANPKLFLADDKNLQNPIGTSSKLKPLLEDVNKKGVIEKRNFVINRMDVLSSGKPVHRVMDYVKKQYPLNEETTNTFFLLGDVHKVVRDTLLSNGWVERYTNPEERAQLMRSLQGLPTADSKTLGRMLTADPVKFIWVAGFINWSLISNSIIVNRIPSSSYYFSKTALATSIRDLYPFLYQKGVVEVTIPRTYEVRNPEDMKHFIKAYRTNACISLIKKFLSALDPQLSAKDKAQLFSEEGTVPLDCVDFAVQRMVEVIRFHQHADIDEWHFSVVSDEDWSVFIFRFYDIIHQDAKFQIKHHNITIPKLAFACEKICTLFEKYFPESKFDGYRNLWILKPSNGSCGRGIRVFKRLNEIQQNCKPNNVYVIQKYIESPLLIYQTKFDIRQWFLITSVYPLVIWMYDEFYLRFCSQPFSLSNVHESVHLCNNTIQYKYKNGIRSPQLPNENMWDDKAFQVYLCKNPSLNNEIEPSQIHSVIKHKMQQAIIASCLVSQDKMYHRANSFHLYGADFMVTPDYNVVLIEINTHPSMKYSTSVTARMCKEVLQDVLKVGLDRRSNPHADTGKFVEIFRQPSHMPTIGVPASAAGVHARKIRLLGHTMTKGMTPPKAFEETTKTPTKFNKWLSYSSIATYKKQNKVNFKYVVLRHTDMPLDPGDSITQRDIGYAGVLDKMYKNEIIKEEPNEELQEVKETPAAKLSSKLTQSVLHKKTVAKLKAKEKTGDKDNVSKETNTTSVNKPQNENKVTVAPPKTNTVTVAPIATVTLPPKQIYTCHVEVKQHNGPQVSTNKSIYAENIQEIRAVLDVGKTTFTQEKDIIPEDKNKKEINVEKINPNKSWPKLEVNDTKAVKSVRAKKPTNTQEKVNHENKDNEKPVNTNKALTNPPVKHAVKVKSVAKTENNSKTKVASGAVTKKVSSVKHKTVRESKKEISKTKSSSKRSISKKRGSKSVSRRPSSGVEKIVTEKLRTESINYMKISKMEKDKKLKRSKTPEKTSATKTTTTRKTITRKKKISTLKSISELKIKAPVRHRRHKSKNKHQTDGSTFKECKPCNDSTKGDKSHNCNTQANNKIKELLNFKPKDHEGVKDDILASLAEEKEEENEFGFQQAFIPEQLIFTMSDSESSIVSRKSNISYDGCSSSFTDLSEISNESKNEQLSKEKSIHTSSIKRYNYRNKYCE